MQEKTEIRLLNKDFKGLSVREDKQNKNKYCKIHKSFSHYTKDCYLRDNDKTQNKKRSEASKEEKVRKNFVLKELIPHVQQVQVEAEKDEDKIAATVDTGSSKSYINKSMVEKYKLQLKDIKPYYTETADGKKIMITEGCEFDFTLGKKLYFKEDFNILNNLPVSMILGNDFLFKYEAKIDMKSGNLIINEAEINLANEELVGYYDNPEKILCDKIHVLKEELTDLKKIIVEYKKNNDKLQLKVDPVEIRVKEDNFIVQCEPFRIPYKYIKGTFEEIGRLIKNDIIEESQSLCCSPGFVIAKKNGSLRLVIDYRIMNENVLDEPKNIPKIFENLQLLCQNRYFSKLDLTNGFNQIKLAEKSKPLTAFMIFNKLYQYKRIPFGLKSGPKIFQKVIQGILHGIDGCFIYIDDIIIYGKCIEEHNQNLFNVFKRLYETGVQLNFNKCEIKKERIIMLGYEVSYNSLGIIKKDLNEMIVNLRPKNKKELQRIIGYLNWFRRFVPKFSMKILPLTELLKKEKVIWTEEEIQVVQNIFKEIKQSASLNYPNFKETFYLSCDASNKGISGCLYQESGVLGYYSKRLTDTEERYTVTEKELYAILKSLDYFKDFIQGFHIVIYTDNKNITYHTKEISKRIHRWRILMNECDFELKHISSKNNEVADLLSRIYFSNERTDQRYNSKIEQTLKILPIKFFNYLKKRKIDNNINIKELENNGRIRLENPEIINELVKYFHLKYGHAGISSTIKTLKYYFDFTKAQNYVQKYIKECKKCTRCKYNYILLQNKRKLISSGLWKTISSDIVGPIDASRYNSSNTKSKFYILTITDIYSRFTQINIIYSISTKEVKKAFELWFFKFEMPKNIITDNGRQYVSTELKRLFKENNINHILIPSYTPSSNGISERINRTINEILRIYKKKKPKELIEIMHRRLNQTYNNSLKSIPYLVTEKKVLPEAIKQVEKLRDVTLIKKGDKIYLRNFKNKNKEDDLYDGPYTVQEIGKKGNWLRVNGSSEWFHIKNIKLFEGGRM